MRGSLRRRPLRNSTTSISIRKPIESFARGEGFLRGTVLVLELVSAGSQASINPAGHFEDRILGIEAALKDEKRFPEKWAYFSFIGPDGKPLAQARPFPKTMCWSCHHEHGAMDNVFVQFYPLLREASQSSNAQ